MVYQFDPVYFDGTIFSLDDTSEMSRGWDNIFSKTNLASYFPPSLTFDRAKAELPDMFHTSRSFNVFSGAGPRGHGAMGA